MMPGLKLQLGSLLALALTASGCSLSAISKGNRNSANSERGILSQTDILSEESEAVFAETLHPLLKERCGACHGASQSPRFAVDNAKNAMATLIQSGKVTIEGTERSRIYLKVRDDAHNCWGECSDNAQDILAQIDAWVTRAGVRDQASNNHTESQGLQNAADIVTRNPSPLTHILRAGVAVRSGAFILEDTAGALSGKALTVPAGAEQFPTPQASTDILKFNLNISEGGFYRIYFHGKAPNLDSDSVFFSGDGTNFNEGSIAISQEIVWSQANGSFNLEPGPVVLEIRRRDAGFHLDLVAVTKEQQFDGAQIAANNKVKLLAFDVSSLCGVPGARFEIELQDYNEQAYRFRNPSIIANSAPLKITGVEILVNGQRGPQYSTFKLIDAIVPAGGGAPLSEGAMLVIKEKGSEEDKFAFSFATCEPQ